MKHHTSKRLLAFLLSLMLLPFGAFMSLSGLLPGMTSLSADAAGEQPGYPNLDYTFNSVNETPVSSKGAPGQITLIVFGHIRCGNTSWTLKSIAGSSWINDPNIRVIFAECNSADANTTKNFANTYCGSKITACYDVSSRLANVMWEYFDLFFKDGGGGTFPFTAIIDGNDRIRNVLSGAYTAAQLKTEIDKISSGSGSENTKPEDGKPEDNKPGETNPGASGDLVNLTLQGTENYNYVNEVLTIVNQTRAAKGLPALALDKDLTETAMQRAAEISLYYNSSHLRPDGSSCFTASSRGTYKAENIAVGYPSPNAVMAAWNSSEGHYANIMSEHATSIGIGCFQGSDGILNWTQFFDNAPAADPALTGSRSAVRTVSIQKSLVRLKTVGDQTVSCGKQGSAISLDIRHFNSGFDSSRPGLLPSNFTFTSSNPAIATVAENGVVTMLAPGTAIITISLKAEPTITARQVFTMSSHAYTSKQVKPTQTSQGYTLHTCSLCNHTYQDSYVPSLSGDSTGSGSIPLVSGLNAASGKYSVKLTWNKATGVDGYYLYQYQTTLKKWKRIASVPAGTTSYTVKSLQSATAYLFAVKAYRNQNGTQISEKPYTHIYTATKPEAVDFSVKTSSGRATLTWDSVNGTTGYLVYCKNKPNDSWKRLALTKDTSYTIDNLQSGQSYLFTVKAYKTSKGKRYYSTYYPMEVTIE
jgi:uncharacterized protein YkwD